MCPGTVPTMRSHLQSSASHQITVNAAEQDHHIDSVIVFLAARAEIKRRVAVELKQGQNRIDIEQLPSCINEDSVHVEGIGSAVILDIIYHDPASVPLKSTLLGDEPAAVCHREIHALKEERDVMREQFGFLSSYGRSLVSKTTDTTEVERFLDMFGPRQSAATKRLQELDLKIARAEKEYRDQMVQHEREHEPGRLTKVSVVVDAERDGRAELTLTYVVSNARWTPAYDVQVSTGKSEEGSTNVVLHYRGSITQTTGENWSNAKLTLSTAPLQLGSEIPSLSPWRIGKHERHHSHSSSTRVIQVGGSPSSSVSGRRIHRGLAHICRARSRSRSRSHSPTKTSLAQAPTYSPPVIRAPSPMQWYETRMISEDTLNTTFTILGRSNIPSDETSHKVLIQVLHLQADLEWVCIPLRKERVFLKCNAVNSTKLTLLPGAARAFLNDNFVAKTSIEHVGPNDTLRVSLGSDPSLRVTYPVARKLNHTTPEATFLSWKEDDDRNIVTHSQRIGIRNHGSQVASVLRVFDHVPVSTDTTVSVKVLVPAGLGPVILPASEGASEKSSKNRNWVGVQKGVKARWAPLDMGGEGTVEWMCDLEVAGHIELELVWEVKAPAGQGWH